MKNKYDTRTRAKYTLYQSPAPKGVKTERPLHARIDSKGTVRLERIITELSAFSSFSSSDIKGLLDGFINQIVSHIGDGYEVDLDDLGHFSASLICSKRTNDPDKVQSNDIHFKTVKFRCSKNIRKRLHSMSFERTPKKEQYAQLSTEKRKERILGLLENRNTIQTSDCAVTNGCSRYTARKDLSELLQAGKLIQLGYGKYIMYALPSND